MTFFKHNAAILLNEYQGTQDSPIYLSTSRKLNNVLDTLPEVSAVRVKVPTSEAKSRAFFAKLANSNAARIAAGGMAMVLVLFQADAAQAQAQPATVSVGGIDGVASVVMQADGSALVTLENGSTITMPAGTFTVSATGEFLVAEAVEAQISAAAEASVGVAMGGAGAAIPLVGLAALGASGGGGGGGGSDSGGDAGSTSGIVVDGYLVDATVFRDLNDNTILDSGEPNTQTDASGNWTLAIDASNPDAKLISYGGTDVSTGKPFTGVLTAPAGSSVVTPLTTLVQSYVEAQAKAGTPVDASEAATKLATALGLGGKNLLDLDPVAEIEADGGSAGAYQAAAQVASVINAASAGATGDDAAASNAVAAKLAEKLIAAGEANTEGGGNGVSALSDPTVIQEALVEGGVQGDQAAAIGTAVGDANGLIANAGGESGATLAEIQEQVEKVQEVVQGDLVDAIAANDGSVGDLNVGNNVQALVALRPVVTDATTVVGTTALEDGLDVSGTGRPGSTVQVTIDGVQKTATVGPAGEGPTGTWTVSFAKADLPDTDGNFAIQARGQASGTTVFTTPASGGVLTVDLTPPSVEFNDLPTDTVSLAEQLEEAEITGTTEVGASVVVTLNGVEKDAVVDTSGNFKATFDGIVNTGETSITLTAVATDALGNVGTPLPPATINLQPVSALTPTINTVPENLNSEDATAGVTLSGTGLAGSTITVSIAAASGAPFTADVTVGQDSTWTYPVPAGTDLVAVDGVYVVSVTASLGEGALTSAPVSGGSVTVDVNAPNMVSNLTVSGDNELSLEESESTVTVTGEAEKGSTVTVKLGAATKEVTVADSGSFSVTFDAADVPQTVATTTIEADIVDAAGNPGAAAEAVLAIEPLSTLEPAITQVAQTLGQAGLDAGLVVSGTGRDGSTVNVTIDGVTKSVTLDGSTAWSVTFATADLPDYTGSYDVTFNATLAGTTLATAPAAGGTLTVDLTAPDGPVIDQIAGDGVLDANEIKSDLVITGTAAENTTVTVTLGDLTATDTVDSSGIFSVTFTAAEIADLPANATVSAFSTDSLDNVSGTTTRAFTVTAPIVGTAGEDALAGTSGNDVFILKTEGSTTGSAGDDSYDFTDPGVTYQEIDYRALDEALTATINMNSGAASSVVKGSLGTDTLIGVDNTEDEGFGIKTTDEDDTVNITQSTDAYSWTGVWYEGGDDTVNIALGEGTTRLSFNGDNAVRVDLDAGTANVDFGDGTEGTVDINVTSSAGGWGRIEIEGSNEADVLIGSSGDDRFIGRGGYDTIDGGLGEDWVRYDRGQVGDGVLIELGQDGIAMGTWEGESFTHSLTNIENASGSFGNDLMIANDDGSVLSGIDGDDTLIGEMGDDVLVGGAGADVFVALDGNDYIADFVIGEDRLAGGRLEDLFARELDVSWFFNDTEFGAVVSNSATDNTITFGSGVTAAQLQAAYDAGTLFFTPPDLGSPIFGTAADDILAGTAGNDLIVPVGTGSSDYGYDQIIGSAGFDVFDLGGLGRTDFVQFDYSGITDNGIVGELNFDDTEGYGIIWKMGGGIDVTYDLNSAGDGVAVVGTQNNDNLFLIFSPDYFNYVAYQHTGGDDILNVESGDWFGGFAYGTVRVDIGGDDSDVTADLREGTAITDSGSVTLVSDDGTLPENGTRPGWELRTHGGNDDVKGSDGYDRFILGAGQDTVDGRGGDDLVRYDRSGISGGVTVDLAAGTATGTWDGETFNHTLISIEGVRGSNGDDLLVGSDGDDFIDGRGGNDTMSGGAGADVFRLGGGHDVILDFNYEEDDIDEADGGDVDPIFEEILYENVSSTKVTFEGDTENSLILKGVDFAELQEFILQGQYEGLATPNGLDDPIVWTYYNNDFDDVDPISGAVLTTDTATSVVYTNQIDGATYTLSFFGQGLATTNGFLSAGTISSATAEKNGVTALTFDNVQMPATEFLSTLIGNGVAARDLIIIGTDNADDLGFNAQNVWIAAGDGDDYILAENGTTSGIAPGAGNDFIEIGQSNLADQSYIYIDQEDAGIDTINGFRITSSGESGDLLILLGGEDSWSHYQLNVNNVDDLNELNEYVSNWGNWLGSDENVGLFIENDGDGALYSITNDAGSGSLGDKIATFDNIITSNWDQSSSDAYSNIIRFVEDLPQLPEVS